jgi:hypothetical protein
MPFSRRDFVQSSLAAAIPGARIRKTWLDASHLSRSGGWNYPHRTRPSFWTTMRTPTAPRNGSVPFWNRLRKQEVTDIRAFSMMRCEASWLPCTPLTKNRSCLAVDPPKSCAWQLRGWVLIRRRGNA